MMPPSTVTVLRWLRCGSAVPLLLLLLAGSGLLWPTTARADLEVKGEKTFQFRDYGLKGDFSQFIHENPTFLADRGFTQSLRLDVTGTIGDRVHVDVSLDDSDENEEDKKLLVRLDGRVWDVSLGRLNLNMPDRDFLLYNRTVLGAVVEGRLGRHRVVAMAGRPEGRSERNFFQGLGSQQEYVLTDRDGMRNPQVVQGSEVVDVDGRRLQRGADYTMDYEEGSVVFAQHLLPIEATSRVTVTFETIEGGSTRQSTLLGLRHEVSLDRTPWTSAPTIDQAGGYARREYVAWTVVRDEDDTSAPAAADTSSPAQSLTVYGLDGAVGLPGGMRLEVEGVRSSYDADTADDATAAVEASSYAAKLVREQGRHSLQVTRQRVEPGFRAVGKETFAKLGRDDDLVADVASTTVRNTVRLGGGVTVTNELSASETNLDGDSSKVAVDFERQQHSLVWKRTAGGSMDMRWLDESSHRHGGGETTDDVTKQAATALTEVPLGRFNLQTSLSTEDNSSDVQKTEDYRQAKLNVSSKAGKGRMTWGAGYSVQEVDVDEVMELARLNTQATLNLGLHPNRRMSSDVNLSRRVERNFVETDTTRPARLDIDTGEAKVRWQPGKKVEVNVKGSLEQRSRILAVTDDRDVVLDAARRTEDTSSTIVTENPVLTLLTSNSIDWRPSKTVDHRFQFRQRLERDAITRMVFSENRATDWRGKWSASKRLRFTGDVVWGTSSSTTASTDRDTYESGLEGLYNFPSGLSLRLDTRYTDLDDALDDDHDEEVWTNGCKVERHLDKTWTARGGLRTTLKDGTAVSLEQAFDLGVTCTPEGSKMRWELAFKNGAIDGTDTSGRDFASFNRRLTFKVDSRLGDDTRLEGNVERIAAGPDGKGGQGYRATTTELKVSVDF